MNGKKKNTENVFIVKIFLSFLQKYLKKYSE